jgi:hypothetical protein
LLKYLEYIKENASGKTSDIKINVDNKNYLVDNLISRFSLVVKKRKMKSLSIKSISGYINKETFTKNGYTYDTLFQTTLTNKDIIIGEYNSKLNNIKIKINDNIIYDIDNIMFDNEALVEKMVNEYMKYLKGNKFTIKEN